jgi:transposase
MRDDLVVVQVVSTKARSCCPLCFCPAERRHSQYTRMVADLPCAGFRIQLILHVRRFFCNTANCTRKIFTERLPAFVLPWARLTVRLCEALQSLGLATCGELGTRLAARLAMQTSPTTILRCLMKLPLDPVKPVIQLGIDDFAFRRGRTFGTVLVNLQEHRVIDLLPDRQVETAKAWIKSHSEIRYVSRDRGSEYASAATQGAPQAVQVADRFHITKNLSEAVQQLLARVLTQMKEASQGEETQGTNELEQVPHLPIEQWRPAPGKDIEQIVATRRAEREARYQQVVTLREQGLTSKQIADRLMMHERTVRHWLKRQVAPDVRQRRKYASDFDPYAPFVLKRWQQGCHNGLQLWREIVAQGYPGSYRMVYRFLETLKTIEVSTSTVLRQLPHYTSNTAVWLFMCRPEKLDEAGQEDLTAFCLANKQLDTTYQLVQDFLLMMHKREGERLDAWLTQVHESRLPELQRFARGVEQDKEAVRTGLTLSINNGQVEGQVTKIKLLKRMMYGRAKFNLLRQRVLHAL